MGRASLVVRENVSRLLPHHRCGASNRRFTLATHAQNSEYRTRAGQSQQPAFVAAVRRWWALALARVREWV
jgi:hypothetical protein